jgi:hypothetical protein
MNNRRCLLFHHETFGPDPILIQQIQEAGWSIVDEPPYQAIWQLGRKPKLLKPRDVSEVNWLNRMFGLLPLGSKVVIAKRLQEKHGNKLYAEHTDEPCFFPATFEADRQRTELLDKANRYPDAVWLLKPRNTHRGQGIELVEDLHSIPEPRKVLVQECIPNPRLYKGRKMNLRLFLLGVSDTCTRFYMHRSGSIQQSAIEWNLDDIQVDNRPMYVVNLHVQENLEGVDVRDLRISLLQWLEAEAIRGTDVELLWQRTCQMIQTVIESVLTPKDLESHNDHRTFFELMGIDVLYDDDLNPILIEINRGPEITSEYNPEMFAQLFKDILLVTGMNSSSVEETNKKDWRDRSGFELLTSFEMEPESLNTKT